MEVGFRNSKLAATFGDMKRLRRTYGQRAAAELDRRMQELRAAPTLAHLLREAFWARPHQLTGNRWGLFSVDAVHPYRLLFEPSEPVPRRADGSIATELVRAIRIVGVEDTHG